MTVLDPEMSAEMTVLDGWEFEHNGEKWNTKKDNCAAGDEVVRTP